MLTLSESAASEWAPSGVRVNTVAPGAIASSGLDTYDARHRDYIQEQVSGEIPLNRFGTEAEVSAAIVFLLSPGASFITGTCLRIDGGAPNSRPIWGRIEHTDASKPFDGFHRAVAPEILSSRT
jgi:citronellol/citronellal dehydrogenase